ncbi:exonuclease SbcCD subunit D [Corynebacterium sp. L4756]|uniref:metallophosphoesterase family protein n=1 Tax=unclassified Corynebacterium TaxID=2624378 RepID=UPI00374CA934
MTKTTFIHTSDFQLGMQRWFLGGEAQARFDDARQESITRLGELATRTGAEFIVVAGDVFEHNSLSSQVTGRAKEALSKLPVPVYLLPGNHDPLVADSIFFKAVNKEDTPNVHVIADSVPIAVSEGVEIVGAPLMARAATHDLVESMLEPLEPTDSIRVAIGHGQIHGWGDSDKRDAIDLANAEDNIRQGTIDYLALGDTHSTMELGSTGAVWFSGSPETTDFKHLPGGGGEADSGNALVVSIEKEGTSRASVQVVKEPIGQWVFESIEADINSEEDIQRFVQQLKDYSDKHRTVIKYGLRGTINIKTQRILDAAIEDLEPVFASLKPRPRVMDLHLAPEADELENLGLTGFAASALDELLEDMSQNPDAVARDAANLLFRLTRKAAS